MLIEKYFYPITTLGPGKRLVIWTQGCVRSCPGCSNPETQTPDPTKDVEISGMLERIEFEGIDGLTVSGGEPFMQPEGLLELIKQIRARGIEDVLVYTGYTYSELLEMREPIIGEILSFVDVLIDGPFIKERQEGDILRGSSNQNIIFLNPSESLAKKYSEYLQGESRVELISLSNGETHIIGIPPQNYEELYPLLIKIRKGEKI